MEQYALSDEEKRNLKEYANDFQNWKKTEIGKEKIQLHIDHEKYFKLKLTPENLSKLTKSEIEDIYKQLWASGFWSNTDWIINKIISENGLDVIKKEFNLLLYGQEEFEKRYNAFRKNVKGFGISAISEILTMLYPEKFCLWNDKTKKVLTFMNLKKYLPESVFKYNFFPGKEYVQCISYLSVLKSELSSYQINNFIDLDAFFWYIHENVIPEQWKEESPLDFEEKKEEENIEEITKLNGIYTSFWIVRAGDTGREERVALDNNLITIHYGLHDFSSFKSKDEIVNFFLKGPENDGRDVNKRLQASQYVEQIWSFLKEIKKNDIVILPLKSKQSEYFAIGIVKGDYEYRNMSETVKSTRRVEWLNKEIPKEEFDVITLRFLRLPRTVFRVKSSHAIQNIIDIMKKYQILPPYLESINNNQNIKILSEKNNKETELSQEKQSTISIEELSEDTCISVGRLREIEHLLMEKKQIIFYGPPGTSKTFVGKEFGNYFTQNSECVEIIQFHPSYSYEDFIEGIKPKLSDEGEATGFIKQSGIFRNIVDKCIKNSDKKFVLIIDEINRGNISKIFGELIYLLEYRNEKIRLTYSPLEEFYIPKNLYIIGTMNSADRSIAFVDYALRRRFYFIEFYPEEDTLKKWFIKNNIKESYQSNVLALLKEINIEISKKLGREYQIGYSYFMNNLDYQKVKRIIDYAIIPLIEQYFFGKKENVGIIRNICNTYLIRLQDLEQGKEKSLLDSVESFSP